VGVDERRVVITGMGLISPVGLDVKSSWRSIVDGVSGIGPITLFPTDGFRVTIAGEVRKFDPTDYMSAKEARRADRNVQFAVAAARQALAQARFDGPFSGAKAFDVGVVIGSGAGGITTYVAQQAVLDRHGPRRLNPMLVPMIVVDAASVQVSVVPPTINLDLPDAECDLDLVPNGPRPKDIRFVLTNSFGFGGHNTVLALGRATENGGQRGLKLLDQSAGDIGGRRIPELATRPADVEDEVEERPELDWSDTGTSGQPPSSAAGGQLAVASETSQSGGAESGQDAWRN
jgi:3-oxoacyl-(acyl-carrier-protein) synthase